MLNEKQQAFCREYIKDCNASAAARRAGYSEKTAGQIGDQLLKKLQIQEYITKLRAPIEAAAKFTYEDACRIVADIATNGERDSDRVRAIERLAKLRGWDQPARLQTEDVTPPRHNLAALTTAELETFEALLSKTTPH